jgi:hypothetical protein
MASPAIFISYRREDSSGHAGRLFDRLVEHFGKERIYRDVDTIQAGENFVEAVRQKVNVSDVVLVLIGPRWLTATDDEGRRRLADENDLVRLEIATGLERNIRVIPVLLQAVSMPRAKDLPSALAGLAQRNAFEIRDTYFDQDVAQLVDALAPTWRQKLTRVLQRSIVRLACWRWSCWDYGYIRRSFSHPSARASKSLKWGLVTTLGLLSTVRKTMTYLWSRCSSAQE